MCSSHQTVLSIRRRPAHPVSVPILPPRDTSSVVTKLRHIRDRTTSACIVCVLHIKPFFLLVDIQHNQCPCRFFILARHKLCGHTTTTAVSRADNAMIHRAGYDRYDIHSNTDALTREKNGRHNESIAIVKHAWDPNDTAAVSRRAAI